MSASSFVLTIAIVLSLVYMGLAVAAFSHLKPEKKKEQRDWLLALTLWWPFYSDMYDGSTRER